MASAVTQIDPDHRLGPRDMVSYRVAEDRDNELHQVMVTDSGDVQLPLGGMRVKASGKTTQQLAAGHQEARSNASTTSRVMRPSPSDLMPLRNGTSKGKVFITGEVNSKGALDLPVSGELTVVKAILQFGGFTQDADLKGVLHLPQGRPEGRHPGQRQSRPQRRTG